MTFEVSSDQLFNVKLLDTVALAQADEHCNPCVYMSNSVYSTVQQPGASLDLVYQHSFTISDNFNHIGPSLFILCVIRWAGGQPPLPV